MGSVEKLYNGVCQRAYDKFYGSEKTGCSSISFLLLSLSAFLYLIGLNTGEIYIQCVQHLMEVKIEIGRVLQFIVLVHR